MNTHYSPARGVVYELFEKRDALVGSFTGFLPPTENSQLTSSVFCSRLLTYHLRLHPHLSVGEKVDNTKGPLD